MRLPEQRLWDRFRKNVAGLTIFARRIENIVGVGDADVETLAAGGVVSQIELKAIERPPVRASTPLLGEKRGLTIEQQNFLARWAGMGGRAFVLIGVGAGSAAEQHLLSARHAGRVNEMTLDDVRRAACASSWIEIMRVLRGD